MESNLPLDAEFFSCPVATSIQRPSRAGEILPVSLGAGFTVTGAVPRVEADRDVSQAVAASRVWVLSRESGQECKYMIATWAERTAFNHLADWGQHSMIQERLPRLIAMCAPTGVST